MVDETIIADKTQKLQSLVDTKKTLDLINEKVSHLSPPIKTNDDPEKDIAIVTALKSTPRLEQLFLEARGLMWSEKEKKYIQISKAYMNTDGAFRLVQICKHIAEETEWSNFLEENIPAYVDHFYAENLPYFTFWYEEYDLKPQDFNFVMTTLKAFILSSFYKAKGGKYINLLGKTYSEDFLGKVLNQQEDKKPKGFLSGLGNPLKRMSQ